MYRKILVPVDLTHMDKMTKALDTAIDIARHYNATLCYLTVTNSTPSSAAHSTEELTEKLSTLAEEQGKTHGIETDCKVLPTADTAVELDDRLLEAIKETGADLIVMASHTPGISDQLHLIHSNGANIVRHSDISVFVVR